jgi:hypothetical protein
MDRPIVHLPSVVARRPAYGDDWISVVPSSARYVPLGRLSQVINR